MDVSGSLSLVQTVIEKLGSPIWTQIEAILGLESELDKLKETMSTIEAVLLDAEEQEHEQYRFTHVERSKLRRLKEALYRADDLFDEITTLGHRKKLMPCNYNKVCNEVCLFFSRSNQLRFAFNWSKELEKILGMLDDIVKDHRYDFGLRHPVGLEAKQMRIGERETHSYVGEEDVIIGREDEKREVIGMLLKNTVDRDVFLVSIVGIGGMGKTTLAREVFNDEMIDKKFPRKLWVCVSDVFSVKGIFGHILSAVNPQFRKDNDLSMEMLQTNLRQELDGKKYLLVLDDVWNEDSNKWLELSNVLIGGGRVSSIIVTTRSNMVAAVVGSHCPHWTLELKGLSEDRSLELLKKMAITPEKDPMKPELVDIGKAIVQKCAYVPLAIRVVGSLLRGQDESKWENLKNTDLANIVQDETNGILPMLKLSYNYLPFHLKSCFSYCAIFPKDRRIIKEDLICLWMAQGFIIPSDGESFEEAGDKYFEQLLQRCFFQDVELAEGTSNEIESCKMHDLIHDLAKEVAGTEILSCDYSTRCLKEKTRHVSFDEKNIPNDFVDKLIKMERMRTFIIDDYESPFSLGSLVVKVSKMKYLRVLGLDYLGLEQLPSGIGELVHLRYLDLSYNRKLCALPSSITKLYNLQTLKLGDCDRLKRLPRELRKLVNLRHLDISGCDSLTHMPPGMNTMTSLQTLTKFAVRGSSVSQLKELEVFRIGSGGSGLSSLRSLAIEKCFNLKSISAGRGVVWEHFTALKTLSLYHLEVLELEDDDDVSNSSSNESREEGSNNNNDNNNNNNKQGSSDAEIMPWRYLAPTLRSLKLEILPKLVKLPKGIGCLSSLHSLSIVDCDYLESLTPSIGGLSSLHSLTIENCRNFESLTPSIGGLSSLQSLTIERCRDFKSLTPSIGGLSSLQSLYIIWCPKFKTMPEEMRHLTSLTTLEIFFCSPELENECKNKNGANWSNIQHIPNIKTEWRNIYHSSQGRRWGGATAATSTTHTLVV